MSSASQGSATQHAGTALLAETDLSADDYSKYSSKYSKMHGASSGGSSDGGSSGSQYVNEYAPAYAKDDAKDQKNGATGTVGTDLLAEADSSNETGSKVEDLEG